MTFVLSCSQNFSAFFRKRSASGWAAAAPYSRFADDCGYQPGSVEHGTGRKRRALAPAYVLRSRRHLWERKCMALEYATQLLID
jgi:hypothetical protein